MIDWSAVEDALQAEIVGGSQVEGSRVRWEIQSRDTPQGVANYVTLRIDALTPVASEAPEQVVTDNPAAFPGGEILIESKEHSEFDLQVTIYSVRPTGSNSAIAIANRTRAFLGTESSAVRLGAAGLAIVRTTTVQRVPALLETEFEDRAVFTARVRFCDGFSEPSTFIESAEWSATFN